MPPPTGSAASDWSPDFSQLDRWFDYKIQEARVHDAVDGDEHPHLYNEGATQLCRAEQQYWKTMGEKADAALQDSRTPGWQPDSVYFQLLPDLKPEAAQAVLGEHFSNIAAFSRDALKDLQGEMAELVIAGDQLRKSEVPVPDGDMDRIELMKARGQKLVQQAGELVFPEARGLTEASPADVEHQASSRSVPNWAAFAQLTSSRPLATGGAAPAASQGQAPTPPGQSRETPRRSV